MKRLLLIACLIAGMASAAGAQTIAVVVKDNTVISGVSSTVKVDTLLGNALRDILGYTVHYRDLDSVHTPGWWDSTGYSLVLFAGSNVPGAGAAFTNATVTADSVAKSSRPMMVIGNQFWNEANLGTGTSDYNVSDPWTVKNLGRNHWITKTQHDSIVIWVKSGGATTMYGILYPDSIDGRGITPLIINHTYAPDTSRMLLAVCESGAAIVNTGDGRGTSNQRRSFFSLWQNQAKAMDSCQFYTLFLRTAAWTAGDTLNTGIMNNICFSGHFEIADAWCGGSEPSGPYGVYTAGGIRMGYDYDDKISFLKLDSLAVVRKVRSIYRSITVSEVNLKTRVSSATVQYPTSGDSNWVQYWTFVPSRKRLNVTNDAYGTSPVASNTYPVANYYWARIDTAGGISAGDTILWATIAARDTTQDVVMEFTDSSLYSRATFVNGTDYYYSLDADRWTSGLLSHDGAIIDYVSRRLYHNQVGLQPPGVEVGIYSANSYASVSDMPSIAVHLSASSTTDPTPSIAIEHDSLVFTATEGGAAPAYQINTISNSSGGALVCQSFSNDAAWLSLSSYDEGTPYSIFNQVLSAALSAGYYSATVTIQCDDAGNTPQTYKVALTVSAAAPDPSAGAVERRTGLRKQ